MLCILIPVLLGLLQDEDQNDVDREKLDYRVIWPAVALVLIQIWLASQVSMGVAAVMIKERSPTMDMREAMKTNITNTAVVSTLFLTTVVAMLQADAPFDDGDESPYRFLSQWYMVLLILATVYTLNSAIMCSLCLMFMEPLDTDASMMFLKDNLLYFGEPLTQTAFAIANFVAALLIWIFGRYGYRLGVFCSAVVAYVVLRIMVVYLNLRVWENPKLSSDLRQQRDAEYAAFAESSTAAQSAADPGHVQLTTTNCEES